MTQAELAERSNVSTELVSRIERGRCLPSLHSLMEFAQALNVSPNYLLGFQEKPATRELEGLVSTLSALPRSRLREVQRIAEALAKYERTK